MKRRECAVVLAFLFFCFAAQAGANNLTTTPSPVKGSFNVSLDAPQPVRVDLTKITNSNQLAAVTERSTVESTKASAKKLEVTESTVKALTESSTKVVMTDTPLVGRQKDASYSGTGKKTFLSSVYGKLALTSGLAFLVVLLGATAFLFAGYYFEKKTESKDTVIMGDVESADDQEDDIYRKSDYDKSGYAKVSTDE